MWERGRGIYQGRNLNKIPRQDWIHDSSVTWEIIQHYKHLWTEAKQNKNPATIYERKSACGKEPLFTSETPQPVCPKFHDESECLRFSLKRKRKALCAKKGPSITEVLLTGTAKQRMLMGTQTNETAQASYPPPSIYFLRIHLAYHVYTYSCSRGWTMKSLFQTCKPFNPPQKVLDSRALKIIPYVIPLWTIS